MALATPGPQFPNRLTWEIITTQRARAALLRRSIPTIEQPISATPRRQSHLAQTPSSPTGSQLLQPRKERITPSLIPCPRRRETISQLKSPNSNSLPIVDAVDSGDEQGVVLRANGPFRVPDADVDDTNAAWIEVRKYHEMFSRAAKRNSRCGIPSDTGRSSLSDQPSLVDVGESVGTPDSTLTSRTGVTPRSARSADLVLLPRGIRVKDTNVIVPSAFAQFKTNRPPEGYYKVDELSHTDIWVSGGDDWVRSLSNEYREMKVLGLCEEEFASFANDQFLRRSPRYLPDSDDRQWRGERMLQLVSPPKENTHWRKPPVLDTARPSVDWSWDIVT
ncbi:hypothetical protein S40293_11471 [Stachybotrys chartarum IBT 40293]|nr:hypothetical protein S40293_11471 [Stachybotrys chartarum IBT 40293]